MSEFKGFFRIQIRKEALKFSSAHMTVFADGTKENLHGHNYRTVVKLEFERFSLAEMLPFADLKAEMRKICAEWDEKVLLPAECPLLKLSSAANDASVDFELCGKRYVLPKDEVVFLPVDNVTTETLAKLFAERMAAALSRSALERAKVRSLEATVEEMLGQGASYVVAL
ncbi:MAG: 6-carboxytetrahydropterin synthase [Bdellovibrionales bacterium]|nr:6-carboxytetrahydropterin synthase [Bdellovibrionales bacterium]